MGHRVGGRRVGGETEEAWTRELGGCGVKEWRRLGKVQRAVPGEPSLEVNGFLRTRPSWMFLFSEGLFCSEDSSSSWFPRFGLISLAWTFGGILGFLIPEWRDDSGLIFIFLHPDRLLLLQLLIFERVVRGNDLYLLWMLPLTPVVF